MKKIFVFILYMMIAKFIFPDYSGHYYNLNRVAFTDSIDILRFENNLNFKYKKEFYNNSFTMDLEFYTLGPDQYYNIVSLEKYKKTVHTYLQINQAYLKMKYFPFSFSDLYIGKQRIVMGYGDIVSPIDYLNPFDLSDPWSFEKRVGVYSILNNLYFGNFCITNVFIPYFTPSVFSENTDFSQYMDNDYLNIKSFRDSIYYIDNNIIDNFEYAFKLNYTYNSNDLAFYYFYSRDFLPWPDSLVFIPQIIPTNATLYAFLYYPRMQICGASYSTMIKDISIWTDFVLYIPKNNNVILDLSAYNQGIIDTTLFEEEYFYKYLIGLSYMFENDFYFNIQYLKGFLSEIGNSNINHYILLGNDYSIYNDKVNIHFLNSGIQINELNKDSITVFFVPSIEYILNDITFDFTISKTILSKETLFGRNSENDGFQLKINYYF